jgi:two-component system chemotaxis response regulator CheY
VARTVLIVDDSPTIRSFARIYLKALGVEVSEAADGLQALELVRRAAPDVCVVDVDMPNMDGLTFIRELRKDPRLAKLPVVLLTGDRTPEAREQGRLAGANDLVQKPIKGPELQEMVKKYLESAA